MTIGVFDSGVGGLTVLDAIRRRLPDVSTAYLGDTARVPYGTRSPDVVVRYSLANARFLLGQGIELLVVACNTASAHALDVLRERLPIPVLGVVEPGARAAAARSPSGRIGVIGTAGTIASGAYQRALAAARPDAELIVRACPLFVPLAEEGWTEGDVPRAVAERYLGDLRGRIDALVLGCTHYPLLAGVIGQVLGDGVALVDSAEATAAAVADALPASSRIGEGRHRTFVTDVPARFPEIAARFLGHAPAPGIRQPGIQLDVEQVDIEPSRD